MQYSIRNSKGFTLIEILISLSLLAILSAITIPNVTGFIAHAEKAAYNTDLETIRLSSIAYYTDPVNRISGRKSWPLKGTNSEKISGGIPIGDSDNWLSGTGYFIDFDILSTQKYIMDVPASVSTDNKIGNTGSYSWYITLAGKVESKYVGDKTTIGFVNGVYP